MTTGFSGRRSSNGGSAPESTLGCSSGGSLRPFTGAAVAGACVAIAPGVGVAAGATPQAVATVPTSVMVDTFKKSRRLIFLLSIAISFCLCYGMKQTHIWQQQPDTFCLILLYHRMCPTTFTFRTKFWIFRTHLA